MILWRIGLAAWLGLQMRLTCLSVFAVCCNVLCDVCRYSCMWTWPRKLQLTLLRVSWVVDAYVWTTIDANGCNVVGTELCGVSYAGRFRGLSDFCHGWSNCNIISVWVNWNTLVKCTVPVSCRAWLCLHGRKYAVTFCFVRCKECSGVAVRHR